MLRPELAGWARGSLFRGGARTSGGIECANSACEAHGDSHARSIDAGKRRTASELATLSEPLYEIIATRPARG